MIDFIHLQAQLRHAVSARIGSGQISGLALARRTGFQQAHISNFIHSRRGLSLEGMDRIMKELHLTVLDLIPTGDLSTYSGSAADREYEGIALVDASALLEPIPPQARIHEHLKFKRTFLRRLRPDLVTQRANWTRFLLFKPSADDASAMFPRILTGATLLIDRHYNSLRPYRRGDTNLYAIRKGTSVLVRYVEITGRQLTLRPHANTQPLDFVPIEPHRSYADYLLGRVCHVAIET